MRIVPPRTALGVVPDTLCPSRMAMRAAQGLPLSSGWQQVLREAGLGCPFHDECWRRAEAFMASAYQRFIFCMPMPKQVCHRDLA